MSKCNNKDCQFVHMTITNQDGSKRKIKICRICNLQEDVKNKD